ncbi:Thiamine pyrophosphokinase 1 [Pseudolycoriella hygida]|uniref:Thiamine pyrophosphokinase 1 n=1 Tax=Pseudolycoriella hygida TaxID=35572 RepID=A0A9Q0ML38_9DIPT|nr:Thiamine pyrophosphokinase 1 [Pseudolycoriella hygida]
MMMTIMSSISSSVLGSSLLRKENKSTEMVWRPSKFIDCTYDLIDEKYAIVVMNRPIHVDPIHTKQLWEKAKCRCLVDGGANRWLDFLKNNSNLDRLVEPELLTGDFDSITDETMSHFKQQSTTKIIHTPSQDHTDFTKALMELSPYIKSDSIDSVVVLQDTSGRIDHIFAHISTLVKARQFIPNVNIYVISQDSISWLLNAGDHVIHIPQEFVDKHLWCSFVPIDGKCCVTTSGFMWNLDNQFVQFGGICSTSNTYSSNVVTLRSDGYLYWSMGLSEHES